jgi:hypothetical protein
VVRALAFALLLAACAAARAADYRIETEFDPPRAYVGSQVVLRQRLLRAPGLPYGVLRPPRLADAAEVSPLGRVPDYRAVRAGRAYLVRERAYLVVPLRAGPLAVPAPELDGPLAAAAIAAQAAPRVLEVLAPRAAPGEPWLPARSVTLEESWSRDPHALAAGEPVVRTLVVRAEGITGNRLPALEMAPLPGLPAHHEADRFRSVYLPSGMGGWRERRVVLLPLDEGARELPPISLAWWDVAADAPRVATLPARTLRIGPAAAVAPPTPPMEEMALSPLAVMRWFALVVFLLAGASLWAYARGQARREARGRLRDACRRGDAAGAREALADWWKAAAGSESAPLLRAMGDAWDPPARAALDALDAALYGAKAWDGKAFWRAVMPWLRRAPRRAAARKAGLPVLFRLQADGGASSNPRGGLRSPATARTT